MADTSKLVSYAVLNGTAENLSKLVNFVVLASTMENTSKLVSFAVLQVSTGDATAQARIMVMA
jgi:hypothetical protein